MAKHIVTATFRMKNIVLMTVLAIAVSLILAAAVFAQNLPTPNSCTSPGALNPIQLIGNVYTQWNCWLADYVYLYYLRMGVDEHRAADYARRAVQDDEVLRLNDALRELRKWDQSAFDRIFVDHGLQLQEQ